MSTPGLQRGLWIAAGLAVLAGCVLSAVSLGSVGPVRRRLARKLSDYAELERLEAHVRRQRATLAELEQAAVEPPADLAVLARTLLPDRPIVVRELDPLPAGAGWSVERAAVTVGSVPFADIATLLEAATSQQWTLAECTIQASTRTGRAGHVELIFEAARRSGTGP